MLGAGGEELAGGEGGVDDAGSLPDFHIRAAGLLADIVTQS